MNRRASGSAAIEVLRAALVAALLLAPAAHEAAAAAAPTRARAGEAGRAAAKEKLPIAPLREAITTFVSFDNAPFPFRGLIPDSGKHFLDKADGNRQGHTSSRDGAVHWEDDTFKDNRVLLYFPKGFDVRKPALIVVFLHGNGATLSRDVLDRQQVAAQVAASGINAVLVAPQFAVDAADSSAGRFWQRGQFGRFVAEASTRLAAQYGDRRVAGAFANSKIVLVAYSGGYLPAAWSLAVGKADGRIAGVVLFDALYGQIDKFVDWLVRARARTFFLSAYGVSTHDENEALKQELDDANLRYKATLPKKMLPGSITFVDVGSDVKHEDFVTQAWTQNPLAWVLARIGGYPRAAVATRNPPAKIARPPR
ncbi:MAG: hypothetical protein ABI846_04745 [Rudaea sp.]